MGGTESGQPGQYENFDGIRAYACVGIVCMHVLKNGNFGLSGFVFERLIPSFTNFTYLFMILSAFSMCCGYYEKFTSGTVDIERFYRRRYQRVWSYFALLCTVETLLEHTLNALCEWFADITLAFALIPNHGIEIVGVGWFLGVVFVFYMLFPFFAFLMSNRKRAWMTMTATIILHTLCRLRFRDAMGRTNFIYCAMFFAAGGIIYLYRDKLKGKMAQYVSESATPLAAICYYAVNDSEYAMLGLFSLVLIVGISCKGGSAGRVSEQNSAVSGFNQHGNIPLPHVRVQSFGTAVVNAYPA